MWDHEGQQTAPSCPALEPPRPYRSASAAIAFAAASLLLGPRIAHAQDAPPPPPPGYGQPPPTYGQPPPTYGQPPPGYEQPPPAYGQPPPMYYAPPPGAYATPSVMPPRILDWEDGQPVPAGYHVATQKRKGMIIGGAITFGTTYLFSLLAASTSIDNSTRGLEPLFVPCIGPFIAAATADTNSSGAALLLLDGAAQSAGAFMIIYGIVSKRKVLLRNDLAKPFILPTPTSFGRGSVGLGMVGTF